MKDNTGFFSLVITVRFCSLWNLCFQIFNSFKVWNWFTKVSETITSTTIGSFVSETSAHISDNQQHKRLISYFSFSFLIISFIFFILCSLFMWWVNFQYFRSSENVLRKNLIWYLIFFFSFFSFWLCIQF